MTQDEDFSIDLNRPDSATLSGVLRLASPSAYEERFEPIRRALERAPTFTIDISKVRFINSSGITGLSRLVLLARTADKPMVLVGVGGIAWQGKILTLLKRLHTRLDVQLN